MKIEKNEKTKTLKQLCKENGTNYYSAIKRRQAGMSMDKVLSRENLKFKKITNEVTVFGITYPNLKEAERALNPPAHIQTIKRWMGEGVHPDIAFKKDPNPGFQNGIVYLCTNKINGLKYVGQTIRTLDRRISDHISYITNPKYTKPFHKALGEFGKDNFTWEILETCHTSEELKEKEIHWIEFHKSNNPKFGYNQNKGGSTGGSLRKTIIFDDIKFSSVGDKVSYIMEKYGITRHAACKRHLSGREDCKKPAKPGESQVNTPMYKKWSHIKDYTNPKSKSYCNTYISQEWKGDFERFKSDMGPKPGSDYILARIDTRLGFTKENCKWMTRKDQGQYRIIQNSVISD